MIYQLYAFIYELGTMNPNDRVVFVNKAQAFLLAYQISTTEELRVNYPAFKLGEEAREAKEKVENLRPTKKKGKK